MLQVLLDEHPAGWSTIVHKDFSLKPGYTNVADRNGMPFDKFMARPENRRPQCYCHGARREEEQVCDEKSDCGAEWAYIFETLPATNEGEPDQKILHVLDRQKHEKSGEYHWQEVGRIDLDSNEEIPWTAIECGENFERCSHYAWFHGLLPKTSNLSTAAYLGHRPLEFHDAVAFIIEGKRYTATGSGGDSNYYNRHGRNFPRDTWVASALAGNGRRLDLPVASITKDGYKPLPGVRWVMPPVKGKRNGTVVTV